MTDEKRPAWRFRINGKALTMVGKPVTLEQALASIKTRWPNANIEII